MMRFSILACALVIGLLTVVCPQTNVLFAQAGEPATQQHKDLQKSVGEWKGTMTMYMPGQEPMNFPATETVTALGKHWIETQFKCSFMGGTYEGHGTFGYDAKKKKHVGTWKDNMSSHLSIMEGGVDAKSKKMVMRWMAPDMTGKLVPHRNEQAGDNDSYTMTFYIGEGEGVKSMEIKMKRVKKAEKEMKQESK